MLPSSVSPFLSLLVVQSSLRRWPVTRLNERRRQNKVEDGAMLKAIYLCQQDKMQKSIIDGKEEVVENRACTFISSMIALSLWRLKAILIDPQRQVQLFLERELRKECPASLYTDKITVLFVIIYSSFEK